VLSAYNLHTVYTPVCKLIRIRRHICRTNRLRGAIILRKNSKRPRPKKFTSFYETRMFITVFTTAANISNLNVVGINSNHNSLSWTWITLCFHLCLDLPTCLFPPGSAERFLHFQSLSYVLLSPSFHFNFLFLSVLFNNAVNFLNSQYAVTNTNYQGCH